MQPMQDLYARSKEVAVLKGKVVSRAELFDRFEDHLLGRIQESPDGSRIYYRPSGENEKFPNKADVLSALKIALHFGFHDGSIPFYARYGDENADNYFLDAGVVLAHAGEIDGYNDATIRVTAPYETVLEALAAALKICKNQGDVSGFALVNAPAEKTPAQTGVGTA